MPREMGPGVVLGALATAACSMPGTTSDQNIIAVQMLGTTPMAAAIPGFIGGAFVIVLNIIILNVISKKEIAAGRTFTAPQNGMKIIGISFRNNNNSLHTSDDISSEYLSIYRDGEILHEQYKAEKEPFRTGKYNIEGGLDEFFDRLENHYHIEDWKKDYSIPVCDGFSWSCTYRTEDKTDHKVKGTIEPPPMGTELVEAILDLADFAPGP